MCDDRMHDPRNNGWWHTWRDEKGRLFATRCPESTEMDSKERETRSDITREEREDWRNR